MNFFYNGNYDSQLINDLAEYIQDEMQDSAYYQELAKLAPTDRSRSIILEFSKDENTHAENFQEAYRMLTGYYYTPSPLEPIVITETNDYEKYGEQYLKSSNEYFKDLFFTTRTGEARHAMRIPILFEEE